MNSKQIARIVQRVAEMRAEDAKVLDEAFKGIPLHAGEPDDAQFVQWYEAQAQKDPNYIPALELTVNGADLNRRYKRLMGQQAYEALILPYAMATMGGMA